MENVNTVTGRHLCGQCGVKQQNCRKEACPFAQDYDLYWSPEGKKIATVRATTERLAIKQAPMPYKRYPGEIYAQVKGAAA